MLKMFQNLRNRVPQVCILIVLIFAQVICDLYLPTLMSSIINNGIMEENIPYILRSGAVMLLIAGIGILCAVIASFLSAHVSADLGSILRSRVFRCVERFSMHEFDKFGASTLTTRTTNDIIQIQTFTILMLNMMLRAPLTAVGGIILAYRQDKGLTLIFAAALPVLVALIALLMGMAMPVFKRVQKKLDKVNLVMDENLAGIRVIRAFNRTGYENRHFDHANSDLTATYIKANRIMAFLLPAFMLAINTIVLCILEHPGKQRRNQYRRPDSLSAVCRADLLKLCHVFHYVCFPPPCPGRRSAHLAGTRNQAGDTRPGFSEDSRPSERSRGIPECHVSLSRSRTTGCQRHQFSGKARGNHSYYRGHRQREIDPRRSDSAFLRRE
ncbi:ABC transporter permease [Sporolactobacillus sp. KGMB 08714]|uniref:ABC transporter permease n=1 Tax=Sporolactobacillus sp. KGMB 08714 TaxID=3064704 RepID=UPI002FBDC4D6